MSINSKMTAIADKIRVLSGTEDAMGLDAMANHVGEANTDVATEADLIAQITTALEGKAAGGDTSMEDGLVTMTITNYTNNRVSFVGSYAFSNNRILTSVNFPAATTIGIYAFQSCSGLTTVNFPVATSIGVNAFAYCSSLTTANLSKVTSIGSYAFYNCMSLTTVNFPVATHIGYSAFQNTSLTTANFPVATSIDANTFKHCDTLYLASLPVATSIGSNAFYYCHNLKSLYLTGSSLCTLSNSNAFTSTPIGGYSRLAKTYGSIYVPTSLLTSYQTATNWTYFSSRFVGI